MLVVRALALILKVFDLDRTLVGNAHPTFTLPLLKNIHRTFISPLIKGSRGDQTL